MVVGRRTCLQGHRGAVVVQAGRPSDVSLRLHVRHVLLAELMMLRGGVSASGSRRVFCLMLFCTLSRDVDVAAGDPAAGGSDSQKLMQDLIKSAQRPVAAGKVRRKKSDAAAKRAAPLNKSKGFASANTR